MQYNYLGKTDMKVSKVGLGSSGFANFWNDFNITNDVQRDQAIKTIIDKAFDCGINYFDTAPWYGDSESYLGKALTDRPRNTYYIATKVGRYNSDRPFNEWFDFSYDRTIKSVENSLKALNIDYIDLIQVHDFEFARDLSQIINETLPALHYLKTIGKVRYIGINSYSIEHLRKCTEQSTFKIDTILTFAHLNLDDSSFLEDAEFFKEKNMGILNAAPFSMGLFANGDPPSWHRARKNENLLIAVKNAFEYAKENSCNLTKLAFLFSVNQPVADLTLFSCTNENVLDENIKFLIDGLNEKEKAVLEEIRTKFFKPLNYKGYGDIDVRIYWEKMANI